MLKTKFFFAEVEKTKTMLINCTQSPARPELVISRLNKLLQLISRIGY